MSTLADNMAASFQRLTLTRLLAAVALLCLPALAVGYQMDDWLQQAALRGADPLGDARDPVMELFALIDGEPARNAGLREIGLLPWWSPPEIKARLWRPLSALTHLLDHRLAPGNAALAHAHSIGWMLALTAVAWGLLRRLLGPGAVAALAAALYALDDARGIPVGWLANRNAVITGVLGLGAVWAYDRWRRDGWGPGAALAPALLAAGLLAGEAAIAATAWLFAWAVCLDRGPLARRLARLLPCAAVVVAWRVIYTSLGFGTAGSGLYLDPITSTGAYLAALPERLAALSADQLLGAPSMPYVFLDAPLQRLALALVLPPLALVLWRLLAALRGDRRAGFFALGAGLSLLPVAATFPAARLLTFAGLGGAGLVALFLQRSLWREGAAEEAVRLDIGLAWALVAVHLVVAPLGLPAQIYGVRALGDVLFGACEASLPEAGLADKTVLYINANELCAGYVPFQRSAEGLPAPRASRLVASGLYDLEVRGVDEHTLEIGVPAGMQSVGADTLLRRDGEALPVGAEVALEGIDFEVLSHNEDGRVDRFRLRTEAPLRDPSLLWRVGSELAAVPFTPPAPGEVIALDGVLR